MSNILWIQPNQNLALTTIANENLIPQEYAIEIKNNGDVPSDWVVADYNVDYPNEYPHEAYRWDGEKIVLDETALNEINAKNAEPTKEELLAQLQELTAKINSL